MLETLSCTFSVESDGKNPPKNRTLELSLRRSNYRDSGDWKLLRNAAHDSLKIDMNNGDLGRWTFSQMIDGESENRWYLTLQNPKGVYVLDCDYLTEDFRGTWLCGASFSGKSQQLVTRAKLRCSLLSDYLCV